MRHTEFINELLDDPDAAAEAMTDTRPITRESLVRLVPDEVRRLDMPGDGVIRFGKLSCYLHHRHRFMYGVHTIHQEPETMGEFVGLLMRIARLSK